MISTVRLPPIAWTDALESLAIIAFALDAEARFAWLNAEARRLLVPPGANLIGTVYLERVHPDDREGAFQRYRRISSGEVGAYRADVRYLDPAGRTLWLRVSARRLTEPDTSAGLVIAIAQVLGSEEAEHAALERSERHLRLALEASRAGTWDWNLATDVVEYSESFQRLLRWPGDGHFHQQFLFRDRLHPDDRERAVSAVQRALQDGQPFDEVYRLRCFDGRYRWFRGTGRTYPSISGEAERFCGVLMDWELQIAARRALETSERRYRYLAAHDELTGLANRRAWFEAMRERIEASSGGTSGAVLLIDLDGFKDVNDSLGHATGDQLLASLGQRMLRLVGPAAHLARLGGDEFVCEVTGPDAAEAAAQQAEVVIDAIARPWRLPSGQAIAVGASVGIALYPEHGRTVEAVLRAADAALYVAKAAGRGTWRFYDADLQRRARLRLDFESRLRGAIRERRFVPYFQPVRRVDDGRLLAVEALARWQDGDRPTPGPGEFIPVAEAIGLMPELGLLMREQALAHLARWRGSRWPGARLAVNVSVRELAQPDFVSALEGQLVQYGLPGHALTIEITESVLLETAVRPVEIIMALRARGIGVLIDDFGLGYSSLAVLKRLPVDGVKIDRSFVEHVDDPGHEDRRFCAAIISMAHSLGLEVIAEGVERIEQLRTLRVLDCDAYQGYLNDGHPLPASSRQSLLEREFGDG